MIISNRKFYNRLFIGDSIYKSTNSWYLHVYRKDMEGIYKFKFKKSMKKDDIFTDIHDLVYEY